MTNRMTARAIVAEARPADGERKGTKMGIRRILVVDDSATERYMLKDLLTKAGYEVISSENGEDAIVKARQVKPDLILMDVVMPNLNGFQATRAITREATTKHIPVILVTTKDQDTDRVWGMRQGARAYLTKPFSEDELASVISGHVGAG